MDRKEWLKWIWYGVCLMLGSWLGSRALGGWHWSNDAAAWVQAIGSIVAIGVAIYIGWQSDRRARSLVIEERNRQARIAAASIASNLSIAASEARNKKNVLAEFKKAAEDYIGRVETISFMFKIETPIVESKSEIFLFDVDSGIAGVEAIGIIEGHNRTMDMQLNFFNEGDHSSERFWNLCDHGIDQLETVAATAEKAVDIFERNYSIKT